MVEDYESYCMNDICFYTRPKSGLGFSQLITPPRSWRSYESEQWIYFSPEVLDECYPTHGWKLHVSAELHDCENVIELVSEVCFRRGAPFKFCTSKFTYFNLIQKNASRTSSGKLLTIYPELKDFETLCNELEDRLKGTKGPDILTDLLISDKAPLYTRYGAYAELRKTIDGETVLGFVTSEGVFVEDDRKLYFEMPSSNVTSFIPERVRIAYDKRQNSNIDPNSFPYEILAALHFSNGGGVYKVVDKMDNNLYVLKEARKYVGIEGGASGWDSQRRLVNQYRTTKKLTEIAGIVPVLDLFEINDHLFLKSPFKDAITLARWCTVNLPSYFKSIDFETEKNISTVIYKLKQIIDECHAHGYAFGDLQPRNILIDKSLNLFFIDLETCLPINSSYDPSLVTPGYLPPKCDTMTWKNHDYYALLKMVLGLYLPPVENSSITTEIFDWAIKDLEKYYKDANYIFIKELYNEIFTKNPELKNQSYDIKQPISLYNGNATISALLTALESSIYSVGEIREKENLEPIYPGSVESFEKTGNLSIFNGITGIGLTFGKENKHVNEICKKTILNNFDYILTLDDPTLLYGLTGIASYLVENELYEQSINVINRINELHDLSGNVDLSLGKGLSGFTLLLLCCSTIDTNFLSEKYYHKIDEFLAYTINCIEKSYMSNTPLVEGGGLFQGPCGIGLMLSIAAKILKRDYLSHINLCLEMELQSYIDTGAGGLQYDEGKRTIAYPMLGSGGLILACYFIGLDSISSEVIESLPKIEPAINPISCVYGGLYKGAAGLLLSQRYYEELFSQEVTKYQKIPDLLRPHLFATEYECIQIVSTEGEVSRRLSLDYGTGSSGIWAALNSIENQNHDWFPIPRATNFLESKTGESHSLYEIYTK